MKNWTRILSKIVVGQIDKIEKHPDADKLIICQVNIGSESVQIVTAPTTCMKATKCRWYWTEDAWQADMSWKPRGGRN